MKAVSLAIFVLLTFLFTLPEPVLAKPKDHSFITKYDGTETCVRCHKSTARDVAESLHYQMQGIPPYLDGWPEGKTAGMMNTY